MADPIPVLERAAQIGGPLPALADGDIFHLPRYEESFVSERFPSLNGRVALRFPTFGDEVEIERLSDLWGGTVLSRSQAALVVCLVAAPATWFRPGSGADQKPAVAVDRIPDSAALVHLVGRWIAWRDDFRSPDAVPAGGGTDGAPEAPVGGGARP